MRVTLISPPMCEISSKTATHYVQHRVLCVEFAEASSGLPLSGPVSVLLKAHADVAADAPANLANSFNISSESIKVSIFQASHPLLENSEKLHASEHARFFLLVVCPKRKDGRIDNVPTAIELTKQQVTG